ncbi:uncharacterized protein BJ212DRAFT_1577305 [Suillus subaureus]|uniref:Uncharacterized protein n=1 Tax=Suillus subaureus TaxID=48587 RepID=A0A9P7EAL3_9AGAM|nr:uncharacterized protein BJ212DRAFT_1577305 [Suillus subaureus]KAG1816158.1 hypothetical protein BJ212DRAFT_1577305 [Suillus subaureus]
MSGQSTAADPQQEKQVSASKLFDKEHQAQFKKMPSIIEHYAAHRGTPSNAESALVSGKRKSTTGPVQITRKTRKSSTVVKKDRVPSTSLRLRPVLKKVVSRRFGDDDDGEEEDRDVQKSKCVRINAVEEAKRKGEEAKKLKDREAIRHRSNSALSLGVASRRNSVGSVSSKGTKTSLVGKLRGTTTGTTRAHDSTLMAPTVSSLAKTSRLLVPSNFPVQVKDKGKEKGKEQKETDAVEQIVSSQTVPRSQGKIFSQPLLKPSEPRMSLAAAAVMFDTAKPPILPRPKVMLGQWPHISKGAIMKLAAQHEVQDADTSDIPQPQTSGEDGSRMVM